MLVLDRREGWVSSSQTTILIDVSFAEYSCFFGTVKRFLQSCVKDCELRRRKGAFTPLQKEPLLV